MIVQIPNILTPEEVKLCREKLEASQWVDGAASAGEQAKKVKFNLQIPQGSNESKELGEIILNALARDPIFNSVAMPKHVFPPLFNRYDVGMRYGEHVDGAFRSVASGARIRQDVSTTIFLTEPEEYEGGELVIIDGHNESHIKLPAGYAIVYPTISLHRVEEVTKGSRWASFFWTQSLIRDVFMRDTLHELDMSIRNLRAILPDDHADILRLVNIYHNLLRQNSDL
ncbi:MULTISPECIES: Fe2+-dependent dioxygenase [unclassified Bartonella]|uniref:Fe2+-dependent dioxygenase n=1 Tax=unclassified Bartonella TaxID=2645622 RepID=UPI0021C5CCFD|nr:MULTISPECIES: Fe2+-dependent dioxygenase [unclassified Bartonella]UXN03318.1 Fe2+-dependent dioxygenase [Bartonella sp. HY406]UXN06274.1 Fe2+-dependent dioxygenase [Bartonella sp. HY761]